jgi:hypothetical protein
MVAKNTIVIVGAVAFGLLSLLSFAALLGLGIRGILVAKNLNLCVGSNLTDDCELPMSLTTSLNDTEPTSLVAPDRSRELEWTYWLAGSTGVALLWALLTVLAMLFVVEVLRDKQKRDLETLRSKHKSSNEVQMVEMGGGSREGPVEEKTTDEDAGVRRKRLSGVDEPDQLKGAVREMEGRLAKEAGVPRRHLPDWDEHDHVEVEKDYIGAYRVREWHGKALRHLGLEGSLVFFFCLLTLILSLESLLWAVALSCYHTNRLEKHISVFVLVEFLAGILLPLLLFLSSVLLAIVLDYVTIGHVDARKRIKRFLPSVTFEEGKKNDYWVIEDRFYFKLEKRDEHLTHKHSLLYSCDKTLSTWLLTGIVALSILLCFSYFVDVTVVEEETLSSCPNDTGAYDCFNRSTFAFVDCADPVAMNQVELVHCFRFLRFAVDTSLITSFAQSFAFYLATVAIFGRVFSAVKTLLHIHRTRAWGVVFLAVGGAGIVVTAVFLGIEDRFQIQVNFLSVLQVCMACLFIVLVGVLVLAGDWYEKIFDHKKVKPLAELLLRYDAVSNAEVQEIEHSYAAQIKREDPTSVHVVDTYLH